MLERDASSLVTIWGADGDSHIFDYSWREWTGLIGNYYLKRWEMFYSMLSDCLNEGRTYKEEGLPQIYGREAFRANEFYNKLADWELNFVATPGKARNPITKGDEIEIVTLLYDKYTKLANEYYGDEVKIDKVHLKDFIENFGEK